MFEELKTKLGAVSAEMAEKFQQQAIAIKGDIEILGNGAGFIKNIEIKEELLSIENKEALQDKLIIALNDFYAKIRKFQAEESTKSLSNMVPPHLAGMFGLK